MNAKLDPVSVMADELNAAVDRDANDDLARRRAKAWNGDGLASTVPPDGWPMKDMPPPSQGRPLAREDTPERYLSHVDEVIASLRARMLDTEMQYMAARAKLVQDAIDRVRALDRGHDERIAQLKAMLDRLEAARA
jgi:hypothetical protein